MDWIVTSLVATIISTSVLAFVYSYLYMHYRERHIGIWALSWTSYTVKSAVDLLIISGRGSTALTVVNQVLFIVIGLLFLWGAYTFLGKPVKKWPLYSVALCALWGLIGLSNGLSHFFIVFPMIELMAVAYVWTGIEFLRFRGAEGSGKYITGFAFIIWGIHTGDYPFLSSVEWFAPWGYLIGAGLKMILAIGILLVYFQKNMKQLDQNITYLNTLIENMSEMFLTYDTNTNITFVNRKCSEIMGYQPEELVGRPVLDLIAGECKEKARGGIRSRMEKGEPGSCDVSVVHKDGVTRVVRMKFSSIAVDNGEIIGGMALVEDITERKQVEGELSLQKAYFQQLFENSPDAIVMLDNADRIIDANGAFERLFQYSVGEVKGRDINHVIVPVGLMEEAVILSDTIRRRQSVQKESVRKRKDGSLVDVSILGYPIVFSDKQVGIYGIYSDITGRRRAEERLKYLSLHDPLTGLYNRAYFEQEMVRLEAGRQFPVSIMVFDVDGLKLVNDTLGHDSGNALLIAAAQLIKESFRGSDMVSRVGGDEFAVLLPQSERSIVESAGSRIQEAVARYNEANPHLPLSISMGFAITSGPAASLANLFKEADNNMYREKLHRSQSARSAIVQTLMKALEARDYITEGHADRLKGLAVEMARALGLPDRSVFELRLLAQFHDIGKVGIPDRILFKNGPLTQAEFAEMQRHCEIGHRIAQSSPDLAPIADWILKHHEWWNGSGYPLGLKGKEIPLECRILAIIDAYDAMTSNRPYRKAATHQEAVDEIKKFDGIQFDPDLVPRFIQVLEANRVGRPGSGLTRAFNM